MKKMLAIALLLTFAGLILGPVAMAQEEASDTFMLEEITVTAEKRSANLQDLPSSVVALPGDALVTLGKTTTEQILESVPNVKFRDGGSGNPDNNIALRGIQRTQSGGQDPVVLPATTAVYVDGVYQGIGGHYDVNRVEVLFGPQGTLYGRSATGGVVAFYTNDPKLGEFGGSVRFEVGTDNLLNAEDAINIPIGEKIALRAAGHYYHRDGYFDATGGERETREGRVKVLFQPTDPLRIVLSGSIQKSQNWGGGYSIGLDAPDKVNYQWSGPNDYLRDDPQRYSQIALNADYDLGDTALTYIAAYHDFEYLGQGAVINMGPESNKMKAVVPNLWPTYNVQTHELRWQSDTEGPLKWLVGATYFREEYDNRAGLIQVWAGDPTDQGLPDTEGDVIINKRWTNGVTKNYGIFTEETFELTDDFRITAGLRYDKTNHLGGAIFEENFYFPYGVGTEARGYPAIWVGASLDGAEVDYDNITYKLRFEYDLTPDSMVYALTATGFLPGRLTVGPSGVNSDDPEEYFRISTWEQQKLTSYEIGTKNQFLDNRLRLNGAFFMYDNEGFPNGYNLNIGRGRPANYTLTVQVDLWGLEGEAEYLLTMNDKIKLNVGYLKTKQSPSSETISFVDGPDQYPGPAQWAMMLEELPGFPNWTATLAYDHTFTFGNGSTLVPRVEFNYKSDHYTAQVNKWEAEDGALPWVHQDAYTICNAALSWTAANQMYTATLWVRNAFDEEYKLSVNAAQHGASIGDPQTVGLSLSAKF